jgi:hypothetical protein
MRKLGVHMEHKFVEKSNWKYPSVAICKFRDHFQ